MCERWIGGSQGGSQQLEVGRNIYNRCDLRRNFQFLAITLPAFSISHGRLTVKFQLVLIGFRQRTHVHICECKWLKELETILFTRGEIFLYSAAVMSARLLGMLKAFLPIRICRSEINFIHIQTFHGRRSLLMAQLQSIIGRRNISKWKETVPGKLHAH